MKGSEKTFHKGRIVHTKMRITENMKQRVLIVGSIGIDDVQTPFGDEKAIVGGSAVYGSYAASALAPVDMVGVAGEDFPEEEFEKLRDRGVDTKGVEIVPSGKTFRWGGEYVGDMDEAITKFTDLNVLADFDPKIPDSYRANEVVFLANIDPELQLKVLDQVQTPKLVMADTMNFWIDIKRDALIEVLKRVDVIMLNAGEARMLFNTNSLPQAGLKLLELGIKYAIVKKGEHGVVMFSKDKFFSAPAMPLEHVRDPTGAGDTFAGAFAGYLAHAKDQSEETLRQAVLVGSAMASYVVEDFSTRKVATVTSADLHDRCMHLMGAMSVQSLKLVD